MTHTQPTQASANKEFLARIIPNFSKWCKIKGKKNTPENLLKYMVRHRFVENKTINRFLSVELYKEELPKTITKKAPYGVKQNAVWKVEEIIPIKEVQIRSNLINYNSYFRDRRVRFPK